MGKTSKLHIKRRFPAETLNRISGGEGDEEGSGESPVFIASVGTARLQTAILCCCIPHRVEPALQALTR
jgi:hypothetical protein